MAPLTFEQSMAQHLAEQQKQRQEQKAQFDKAQAELKNHVTPLCKNFGDFGNYFSEYLEL